MEDLNKLINEARLLVQQSNALLQNARFVSEEKSDLENGLDEQFLVATGCHIKAQEAWLEKLNKLGI